MIYPKLFSMKVSEAFREKLRVIARYHGISAAEWIRRITDREYARVKNKEPKVLKELTRPQFRD